MGAYLNNQAAMESWNRSITFDKAGASQQFSIEIESMNQTLQFYGLQYFMNTDLSYNGSNFGEIKPDVPVLLMITAHDAPSYPYEIVLYNDSVTFNSKSFIVPGYVNGGIVNYTSIYGIPPNGYEILRSLTFPIIPTKLYDDHGMYYVYVKDIPKFNPKLANDLNIFYNEVASAESDREYLQNYIDANKDNKIQYQYFNTYMDMRVNIMKASKLAPILLQELSEKG